MPESDSDDDINVRNRYDGGDDVDDSSIPDLEDGDDDSRAPPQPILRTGVLNLAPSVDSDENSHEYLGPLLSGLVIDPNRRESPEPDHRTGLAREIPSSRQRSLSEDSSPSTSGAHGFTVLIPKNDRRIGSGRVIPTQFNPPNNTDMPPLLFRPG